MTLLFDPFVSAFVTLFLVIDPIGLMPMFLALTQDHSNRDQRRIALRSLAVAFGILALFALAGEQVLGALGISMPAFRIAGGLLLFLTAVDMLFEKRTERRDKTSDTVEHSDPSVFPLAMPLIAGPGAIAAMILLAGAEPDRVTAVGIAISAAAAVLLVALVLFLASGGLRRLLGKTGINVITRVLGMLLAALAVQFVVDGLIGTGLLG